MYVFLNNAHMIGMDQTMDVSVSLLSKCTSDFSYPQSQSEAKVEVPTVYNLLGVVESCESTNM